MPKISIRGRRMPESPIRKLAPYADIAKQKGHKVYHLNIGQPDIKSPEIAIQAIKNIDLSIIEYGPSAGYESYRKKLAQFYTKQDVKVSYEDIMITTGGSEALLFALGSIMDPGDEVTRASPSPRWCPRIPLTNSCAMDFPQVLAPAFSSLQLTPE